VLKKPSVGWAFDFFDKHQFQVVEKFRIKDLVLGISNIRIKQPLALGVWKKSEWKSHRFWLSRNLKELLGFMKEPAKNLSWSSFWAII
jgi:hypothetical protein